MIVNSLCPYKITYTHEPKKLPAAYYKYNDKGLIVYQTLKYRNPAFYIQSKSGEKIPGLIQKKVKLWGAD